MVITDVANTAVGDQALVNNTGEYNTATGFSSLIKQYQRQQQYGQWSVRAVAQHHWWLPDGCRFGRAQNCIAPPDFAGNTADRVDEALFSDTTGNFNTALGDAALKLNTTGSANTAIGLDALVFNGTGDLTRPSALTRSLATPMVVNTAIGIDAAINNLTGDLNTGFGEALNDSVTGSLTWLWVTNTPSITPEMVTWRWVW